MKRPITKSIELAIRHQINRWFRADRNPIVVDTPMNALDLGESPRILVLRQDRIGDILISTPIVRALRQRFPAARIDALLSDNNIAALRAYEPFINNVLHYRKSVVGITSLRSAMRANAYDVVVDMTDNASTTSSMLVTMSNARFAVGIDKENRGAFTHVVPRVPRDSMHIVDRIVRLLWPFGIDDSQVNKRMEYRITEDERATAMQALKTLAAETPTEAAEKAIRVGINISGSDVTRRLDAATTIDFIAKIRKLHVSQQGRGRIGLEFYVFTTPDLVGVQHAICSSADAVAVPVSKSFHAYACALSCMHAIITPDTAAVHLAAAWQMPSVVLYRPEYPAVHPWYPYNSYSVACHTQTNSVANINADEIADAANVMLRESGLTSAQPLS